MVCCQTSANQGWFVCVKQTNIVTSVLLVREGFAQVKRIKDEEEFEFKEL